MHNISHCQARRLIQKALTQDLDEIKNAALGLHLAHCRGCQAYAGDMHRLHASLPGIFHGKLDAQAEAYALSSNTIYQSLRRQPMSKPTLGIASLLAAFVLAILVYASVKFVLPIRNNPANNAAQVQALEGTVPTREPLASILKGLIAFTSTAGPNSDTNPEISLINPDGNGRVTLAQHPGVDWLPVWSPDGRRLAFISDRSGRQEMYVMDQDGTNIVQVTHNASPAATPVCASCSELQAEAPNFLLFFSTPRWSADGSQLAASYWFNDNGYNLALARADGTGDRYILGVFPDPVWSPTENIILVKAGLSDGNGDLLLIDPSIISDDGKGATSLVHDPDWEALTGFQWSPDGSKIAYFASTQKDGKTTAEIRSIPRSGGAPLTLLTLGTFANTFRQVDANGAAQEYDSFEGGQLAWAPDGKSLAYIIGMQPGGPFYNQVLLLDLAGSSESVILYTVPLAADGSMEGPIVGLHWSPDGQALLFGLSVQGEFGAYTLNIADARQNPGQAQAFKVVGPIDNPYLSWQPVRTGR